jgi:dihydroorotase
MSLKLVLKSVSILGAPPVDIEIEGGLISLIGKSNAIDAQVIDCAGFIALPGFVDLHTHLREPGRENSETIATGSQSAARGGYVAVSAMANTLPVADTAAIVEQVQNIGSSIGLVDVFPVGAVTKGLAGKELSDIGSMASSKARVRSI